MTLISIDREKCKGDGVCALVCPVGAIKLPEKGDCPVSVDGADRICIGCGHCFAVCPQGALTLKGVQPSVQPTIQDEMLPTAEQLEHLFGARRSIRSYNDQVVEHEVLQRLIEIANYAPSARNARIVEWLVIEDTEKVRQLAGLVVDWMRLVIEDDPAKRAVLGRVVAAWDSGEDVICREAPHLVVAHGPHSDPGAVVDGTIALTYLELAAFSLGLGACWAGFLHVAASYYQPLQDALDLPDGHRCCGAMMIGYPRYRYHRIPVRPLPPVIWR